MIYFGIPRKANSKTEIWAVKFIYAGNNRDVYPDNKIHGANMEPIWGRQDPGGPHVGPMNFAIWVVLQGPVLDAADGCDQPPK